MSDLFPKSYPLIDFNEDLQEQVGMPTSTAKFDKSSLNIMNDNLYTAKIKIRAFDVLGPAFTYFHDKKSCDSVNAVPSGATAVLISFSYKLITSI